MLLYQIIEFLTNILHWVVVFLFFCVLVEIVYVLWYNIIMFDVIIPSAGSGTRMKSEKNKLFMALSDNKSVLYHTIKAFVGCDVGRIIIPHRECDSEYVQDIISEFPNTNFVTLIGGATRTETVSLSLEKVQSDIVLIHDGARPFVSRTLINSVVDGVKKYGASIPILNPTDTVKQLDGIRVVKTLDRNSLALVQTPQGFYTDKIKLAYSKLDPNKSYTDDASVYEDIGEVFVVDGEIGNIKITNPEDLPKSTRYGVGFDAHRFDPTRPLILGGLNIPYDKGLLGHSDADVVLHALMDAILSSINMRDIGYHFPCTPEFKDSKSTDLLKKVLAFLIDKGGIIDYVSIVIVAEKPKLSPHIENISQNIAKLLGVSPNNVAITATTTEKLGFTGREEGIATEAIVTIRI